MEDGFGSATIGIVFVAGDVVVGIPHAGKCAVQGIAIIIAQRIEKPNG